MTTTPARRLPILHGLLTFGLLAGAGGPMAMPVTAEPATVVAESQDDTGLLQLRYRVAMREAASAQRRMVELRREAQEAGELLSEDEREELESLTDPDALERATPSAQAPDHPGQLAEALEPARALREESRTRLRQAEAILEPHRLALQERRYQARVDQIAEQTAALRGLELTRPLDARVLYADDLRTMIDGILDSELTPERMRGEGLTWIVFDLIPADTDLRLLYTNLLEDQVGGLYDDREGVLYIVDAFDPFSLIGGVILSHEITHALQDMHFSIEDLPFRTGEGDQDLATAAVLEGDATILMIEWGADNARATDLLSLTQLGNEQAEALETVPPALVQSMLFPYIAGIDFFNYLRAHGVEDWRDRPFRDVPRSTSQIIHPQRYLDGIDPVEVELPEATEEGDFEQVYRGTAGEWMTRLVLTPHDAFPTISFANLEILANDPQAVAGSREWAGDRMATFATEDDSEWFVAWRLAWRSETGANAFGEAFARRLGTREAFGPLESTGDGGERMSTSSEGEQVVLVHDGTESLVLKASSPEALTAARSWIGIP